MPVVDHGENSTLCPDELATRLLPPRFPPRFKLTCPPLVPDGEISKDHSGEELERNIGGAADEALRTPSRVASPPLWPRDIGCGFAFRGEVEAASTLLGADYPHCHVFSGEKKKTRKLLLATGIAAFSIMAGLALTGVASFVGLESRIVGTEEIASKIVAAPTRSEQAPAADPESITVIQQSAASITEGGPTTSEPDTPKVNHAALSAKLPQLAAVAWPEAPGAGTPGPDNVSKEGSVRAAAPTVADEAQIENGRAAQITEQSAIRSTQPLAKPAQFVYAQSGVNIRSTPSSTGDVVGSIPRGARLEVTSSNKGWTQVDNGRLKGWIYGRFLGPNQP
ncbi:MAG TPA: SH3 domain-containing protein [Gemmatimonadales bacterium]|nr:SH3 domain-containing protein [Gemmatimonadales bacterium]